MQEPPPQFQTSLAPWALLTIIGGIVVIAGLSSFLLKQTAVRSRLTFALGLLVAGPLCGAVLLGFMPVGVKVDSSSTTQLVQRVAAPPTSVVTQREVPEDAASAEPKTDNSLKSPLPEWTQRNPIREGERRIVVISGGRFASEDEAELHALDQATIVVTQEYRQLDPQRQGTRLPMHRDLVVKTAIKKRFLETREHDFGKLKGLMYQVWLQLELSPDLGDQIAAPWREAAVEARIRLLAGIGIWLTAVMGLTAFAFRWDNARQGRNRMAVFATVVIVAAGSLLFIA